MTDKAFLKYEEAAKAAEKHLDRIRGSLFGGAAGDALGYAVEFLMENEIFSEYGRDGIREYDPDPDSGRALISDDTQMSLFTANGILFAETQRCLQGAGGPASAYMGDFYREWNHTQNMSFEQYAAGDHAHRSWLMEVPELFARRAPGFTCLNAINAGFGTIEKPINYSKGCGGIMRAAPLGLRYRPEDMGGLDMEGAKIAALTHGNSLGYMPAAMLVHIVSRLAHEEDASIHDVVEDARNEIMDLFAGDENLEELIDLVDLAISLSDNRRDDLDNIHKLGEGWVAEETLAIALYCSLRYRDDFSKALTVSVNHNGDSDSTGAVTGNILGALIGYDAIEDRWKQGLELSDVILEMADDLCFGCRMEAGGYRDEVWMRKYTEGRR